jgi:hypothetical protein
MADAGVNPQRLQGIVASMMERQMQEMKAPPSGLIGGIWEKATGEIQKYNEAVEEHVKVKTKFDRAMQKLQRRQEEAAELTRRLRDNIFEEGETAESTRKRLNKLNDTIETLKEEADQMAESVDTSTQSLNAMNEGGGIVKNGLTALALKAGGAAASFFGFREAIAGVDDRLKIASKTIADFGARGIAPVQGITGGYIDTLSRVKDAAFEWNSAITDATWELTKFGIGAEETRNLIGSLSDGLRLTTDNQGDLIASTKQMTEDVGFLSKLLRVNTDDLANATVDASKRFGKSTKTMADELAGLYVSLDTIKQGSRDTVMNFGDLTRATLEAQSSFQGYNFNLRATANILGNVVAKAQEQGATYEMSMKAAEGLAGVITGGKAPDWAKYIAGRDMLSAARKAVEDVKKEGLGQGLREELGKQFKIKPEELKGLSDIQVQLAKEFSLDPTTKAGKAQLSGLEKLTQNYKKYGALSSAKMAEELLRGTEQSNEAMFGMMKKMADKPEGRELLMRVWGLDEAAATAATLALHSVDSVEKFTKLKEEAKAATAARKPVSAADLKEQTKGFAAAIGQTEKGVTGVLGDILSAIKASPIAGAAVGFGGAATTIGMQAMQMGIAQQVGNVIAKSKIGQGAANILGADVGAGIGRVFGRGAPAVGRSGGMVLEATGRGRAMETLSKATTGVTDGLKGMRAGINKLGGPVGKVTAKLGKMGGPMAKLAGKAGFVGLAAGAGYAVGSLIRLIPGVDSFTEGLINSTAKLIGFQGALDDAETSQAMLNNKSEGVQKALAQVTAGITSDYEKDSLARMVAVRQLQGATKEDLQAYAKKIASTGKLTEKEAMARLEKLASEKADQEKYLKLREQAEQDKLQKGEQGATELMKAQLDAADKLKKQKDEQGATELMKAQLDAADKLKKQKDEPQERTGSSVLTPKEPLPTGARQLPEMTPFEAPKMFELPKPTRMPQSPQARREARHREQARRRQRSQQAGQQPRAGRASVRPDGTISLNVMIPRDALDQSNTQSDGYVR